MKTKTLSTFDQISYFFFLLKKNCPISNSLRHKNSTQFGRKKIICHKCVKRIRSFRKKNKKKRYEEKQSYMDDCFSIFVDLSSHKLRKIQKKKTCRPLRCCQMFHNFVVWAVENYEKAVTYFYRRWWTHWIVWNRLIETTVILMALLSMAYEFLFSNRDIHFVSVNVQLLSANTNWMNNFMVLMEINFMVANFLMVHTNFKSCYCQFLTQAQSVW